MTLQKSTIVTTRDISEPTPVGNPSGTRSFPYPPTPLGSRVVAERRYYDVCRTKDVAWLITKPRCSARVTPASRRKRIVGCDWKLPRKAVRAAIIALSLLVDLWIGGFGGFGMMALISGMSASSAETKTGDARTLVQGEWKGAHGDAHSRD